MTQVQRIAIENAQRELSVARAILDYMLSKYSAQECAPEYRAVKWAKVNLDWARQDAQTK